MIVAAAAAAPRATNGLSFNWFDVAALAVLGFGVWRGRRNGMSKELLPLLKWLVLVPVCGLVYPIVAGYLDGFIPDALWNRLVAYVGLALVVLLVFRILKDLVAEKLVKSDFFKGGEYYLGMMAGMLRYACVLIFALALLNAPVYTASDIAKTKAFKARWFGGGMEGYNGDFFPTLQQIQEQTFKNSFLGPLIKDNAGRLLITTGKPDSGSPTPEKNAPPPKPKPVIIIGGKTLTNLPAK